MFLAPLNYDRYFKKVFSDPNIAQPFLEDVLDVKIQDLEPLGVRHKLTDAAAIEQGIEQGEKKKSVEMASSLKKKGMPMEEIAEISGLSLEEITNL